MRALRFAEKFACVAVFLFLTRLSLALDACRAGPMAVWLSITVTLSARQPNKDNVTPK